MMKSVFCLANDERQADVIVDRLLNAGFSNEEISVLFSDRGRIVNQEGTIRESKKGALKHDNTTKAPEGAAVGGLTGGIIGGTLGLLAGIGTLAIPGFGPFIAAGPIMAALSGSAVGGSLGLLVGALAGLGIPEYEAKKYENKVKEGNVLICVHVEKNEEIDAVKDIMKKAGAKDISSSREKAAR